MGWSPYKEMVVRFVGDHPGCCKFLVAEYVTRSPLRCPSKQYYIVNTAIRNGWIRAQWKGNRWALFPVTCDAGQPAPSGTPG